MKITKNQRIETLERKVAGLTTMLTMLQVWSDHADRTLNELSPAISEPKPQLKQLDQSVFDGLSNELRFASVDDDGRVFAFDVKPELMSCEWDVPCHKICQFIDDGYDTSNWQNSLIERDDIAKELLEVDLSSELTGSDYYYSKLVTERLETGQKLIMCFVSNMSESDAMQERHVEVIASVDTEFNDTDSYGWQYAVPINNQGEPLTASQVGL